VAKRGYRSKHAGAASGGEGSPATRKESVLHWAILMWLVLVAAMFVPALLCRESVPGAVNYLTLLLLPGVIPAVAGAMAYMLLAKDRPTSAARKRGMTLALIAAFLASAALLAVQSAMDKDRSSGADLVTFYFIELFIFGLANAVLAALVTYGLARLRECVTSRVRRTSSSSR